MMVIRQLGVFSYAIQTHQILHIVKQGKTNWKGVFFKAFAFSLQESHNWFFILSAVLSIEFK